MMEVQLLKDMTFIGKSATGHSVVMDTSEKSGGNQSAPTPMEMVLFGLGGCTGMDVISILRKMRQDVTGFRIEIEKKNADEHPKVYTEINMKYIFSGRQLDEKKIARAIELSQDRYCSVSAMLGKTASISHTYEIEEEQ